MKRRSWVWLVASVIMAALAGVLAIVILSQQQQPDDGGQTNRQPLVIARNPIAAGSILRADNLFVEERDQVPSGAAVRVQDVQDGRALRDIAAGEVILMQDVTFIGSGQVISGSNAGLAELIPDDKIAVAIPADDILSNWGAVVPGDHVDILFTIDTILETPMSPADMPTTPQGQALLQMERDQSLDNVSLVTLQNLEVLQILEEPQMQPQDQNQDQVTTTLPKRALLVQVDPQDAAVLKYILDSPTGKIDLALRSPTNSALFDLQPVNINYLVLRYGIVLPQPLQ